MRNAGRGSASLTKVMATATGLVSGQAFQSGGLNGTLVTDADTTSPYNATVEISPAVTVKHYVSNAMTYAASVEATWAAITLGKAIYYDLSALVADPDYASGTKVRLTTSPKDKADADNVLYGHAVTTDTTATATAVKIEIKPAV